MDVRKLVENPDDSEKNEETASSVGASTVSEDEFEEIATAALDGVGGMMLFKMRIENDGFDSQLVAAGSVGDGKARHFLILSMPAAGGQLRVEQASDSKNPIAGIVASYAGLADVFSAAA
jgi:hypothetical protein